MLNVVKHLYASTLCLLRFAPLDRMEWQGRMAEEDGWTKKEAEEDFRTI